MRLAEQKLEAERRQLIEATQRLEAKAKAKAKGTNKSKAKELYRLVGLKRQRITIIDKLLKERWQGSVIDMEDSSYDG